MNQTEVNSFLKPQPICFKINESVHLNGEITVPDSATALVVFVNGCGRGRHTPANLFIARCLVEKGIATLIVDLLTEDEQLRALESVRNETDLSLLEDRLVEVIDQLAVFEKTEGLKIALFGTGDSTAAMLLATLRRYKWISTVVSVDGRPDLVGKSLAELDCPLLFVLGDQNRELIQVSKKSLALLQCQHELSLIPGFSERLEEPGAIEPLAEISLPWLQSHLG